MGDCCFDCLLDRIRVLSEHTSYNRIVIVVKPHRGRMDLCLNSDGPLSEELSDALCDLIGIQHKKKDFKHVEWEAGGFEIHLQRVADLKTVYVMSLLWSGEPPEEVVEAQEDPVSE